MTDMGPNGRIEGTVRTVDAEGRLLVDARRAGEYVMLDESADGTITMTPVALIPRRELERWLRSDAEHV